MHSLHNYLAKQLDKALRQDRVVVFYDARSEFEPFMDELELFGDGDGGLLRYRIGDTLTHVARFEGSFFALKARIEPLVSADQPETLLVYLLGQVLDRDGSVLMEVERAGQVYGDAPSHALKSMARRLLRKQYTDGDIDEMLHSDSLSYKDVVSFLGQGKSDGGSLVKLVLEGQSSEDLITDWIVSEDKDEALSSKLAEPELYRLIHARLGLETEQNTPLTKARHQKIRYLLINEFRSDLSCNVPDALKIVPVPKHKDESKHIAIITAALRENHGDAYVELADGIEKEFGLANIDINPASLGAIDTFCFEEHRLLDHAANLITGGHYAKALAVVAGRGHSFWVDHPAFLGRLAQWEACRLMAELGIEVDTVRPALKKIPAAATKWVEAYAQEAGWYRVDRAQRTLEA